MQVCKIENNLNYKAKKFEMQIPAKLKTIYNVVCEAKTIFKAGCKVENNLNYEAQTIFSVNFNAKIFFNVNFKVENIFSVY